MQKEREEFIAIMVAEGVPLDVCRRVIWKSNVVQRLAAKFCNVELTLADERANAEAQNAIVEMLKPYNVVPVFSGDPRGACVKLKVPSGRTNDCGGVGVCVATNSY